MTNLPDVLPPCRHDDDEWIDHAWLIEWAIKKPFTWDIPETDLFLHQNETGPMKGSWTIYRLEDNGEETSLCHVLERGELRRILNEIQSEGD